LESLGRRKAGIDIALIPSLLALFHSYHGHEILETVEVEGRKAEVEKRQKKLTKKMGRERN
jgi:hypothetical protein